MISVLIPVFNINVEKLVHEVLSQFQENCIVGEVVLSDDCSEFKYLLQYDRLGQVPNVKILRSEVNHGRAKNRNRLANAASNQYLIFIDSDIQLPADYLKNYIDLLGVSAVVVGGVLLGDPSEDDGRYYFRRYFGMKREAVPLYNRSEEPYRYFNSCNFFIEKKVFETVCFNEAITTYGHEDTNFGSDLQRHEIAVMHTANPVVHYPNDTFDGFMSKTHSAVENLANWIKTNPEEDINHIKLASIYFKLQKGGLLKLSKFFLKAAEPWCIKKLQKREPDLFYFDIYRLSLLVNSL